VGKQTAAENRSSLTIAKYLQALKVEIAAVDLAADDDRVPLETVFFGGGTPSLLSPWQIEEILTTLHDRFSIAADAEISMEIDPGTFDLAKLRGYLAAGVNRFSLGVQAFQAELLQICGRSHNLADVAAAIDTIENCGVDNWSLDLISGLPHQTIDMWEDSLTKAIDANPAHISCYDLIVEPVVPFSRQYSPGKSPLPDDETSAKMYRHASAKLAIAGYQHYEISNYAKPGFACRHNQVYWHNKYYYGFGMGAASYVKNIRFTRPRKSNEYFEWVAAGCQANVPSIDKDDRCLESIMLSLRLAEGINLRDWQLEFGEEKLTKLKLSIYPYVESRWVIETGEYLRLNDPEGFLFSNTILASIFEALT
jgi:oxygen-independent coproporphyrinogen-3 oxidase